MRKKEKGSIRIIADPNLLIMHIITFLLFLSLTASIIYVVENEIVLTDNPVGLEITFIIPTVFMLSIQIAISPQWSTIITISNEGIHCQMLFRKNVSYQYNDYPLIYRATYVHGMVGTPSFGPTIVYIVLSKRRLSYEEKTNVNKLKNMNDCIKIIYRKKRYEKLLSILPYEKSRQLEAAFSAYVPTDMVWFRPLISKRKRKKGKKRQR